MGSVPCDNYNLCPALQSSQMKREITLGQLISVGVTILSCLLAAYIALTNQVARLEEKDRAMENQIYNIQLNADKKFDKIDNKLDNIGQTTNETRVLLEKKADR